VLCVSFPFLVYCFFLGGGLVCPGGYTGLSRGGCGIPCHAWCSPVGLPDVSQAGLELVSGDTAALLFSQCNVV
jgi:hypothetical protein